MEMERCKETVLIVHNHYQIPGGEDTVVRNEKELLEEHGHKVILYTRNNSELNQLSKVGKLLLPFTTIFNFRTYREIQKIIREEQVDIVHVHNTLNLISPAVYYAAGKQKKPVVQTVHNFRLLCPGAAFYRDGHICEDCVKHGLQCAVKHKCYRGSLVQTLACVLNLCFHRMTGIYRKINYICLTEFNKEKLLLLPGLNPDRIYVKPNFTKQEPRNPAEIEKREDFFLYAGRLDPLKGIKALLEVWGQMGAEAPKLVICGSGSLEEWCRQIIQENQLNRVELRGQTKWDEVQQLIGKARAMLLPTQWYEGFPMTIVEAYSQGTPVIGPDMGNVGDLIQAGKTGWKYDPRQSDSLKETILKAAKQTPDYKAIQAYDEQMFGAENNYQKFMQIYQSVESKL